MSSIYDEDEKTISEDSFYLNYGASGINPALDLNSLCSLFQELLPKRNPLTEARHREVFPISRGNEYYSQICDFCAHPMTNTHVEILPDGRIRCERCSQDQIETKEEFQMLYTICRKNFENLFKVDLPHGIQAHLSSHLDWPDQLVSLSSLSKEGSLLHRLGMVCKNGHYYEIYLENGLSRLSAMVILICAFTLIWQDFTFSISTLQEKTKSLNPIHYEEIIQAWQMGMALWAGVEYLWLIGEVSFAKENDKLNQTEEPIVQKGYLYFKERYPFQPDRDQLAIHHPLRTKKYSQMLSSLNVFLLQEFKWQQETKN